MQYGAVGLVTNCTKHFALRRRRAAQQRQRLVRMGCHDHPVEVFDAAIVSQRDTIGIGRYPAHRRARPPVADAGNDLVDIGPGAAANGPPLGSLADLVEPVVMAKADHGRNRELQHLLGWAAPDASHHGQEVPVAKRVAKAVLAQELCQRLLQRALGAAGGDAGRQGIKAQQVA